jgi:hypothetical protein
MQDDGGEPGAIEHRFGVERIDPARGSAVGYLAAYIGKNLDGRRADGSVIEGGDFEAGADTDEGADRARAWASRWGIRQFQQIGGPSVTVWRELRRLRDPLQLDLFEAARSAADAGQWDGFVAAMGGPVLRRADRPIKPVHEVIATRFGDERERVCGVTGYTAQGSPADGMVPAGVRMIRRVVETRTKRWTVRSAARTRVNNCTGRPRARSADAATDDPWRDALPAGWWSEAPPPGSIPIEEGAET